MTGFATAGARRPGGPKAIPPEMGWRLQEALEALCPEEVNLYRKSGAALDAAVEKDLSGLRIPAIRVPENKAEVWLSQRLVVALQRRLDLRLTGKTNVWTSSVLLPNEVMASALQTVEEGNKKGRWWIILDFQRDIAFLREYLPGGQGALVVPTDLQYCRVVALTKPPFTYAAGVAFYLSRLESLGGHPQPSEADWVNEFKAHFSGRFTRADIRSIRQAHSPASALKPGRRPRN